MAQNSTLLCVPLVASSVEEMLLQMGQAKDSGADIVEIRLDHLKDFEPQRDLEVLIKGRKLPAIVTYRPKWEGGEYEGDEQKRLETLRQAISYGADYVDVELLASAADFISSIAGSKHEVKVIVSSHNYDNTPSVEELTNLVAKIQATGADIVKLVTTATDITDVARVFQVMVHSQNVFQVPIIGLVMKERGLISRVLCPKYGGYLTFGTLEGGKESAPGQPTIKDLLKKYKIKQVGRDTKIFGIIGKPVAHSKGPILHNAAFSAVGYDAVYVHFLVDDLARFLDVYASSDFPGFSCTIPHKEAALKCCHEVDPVAKLIGAVNTIVRRPSDGKLCGYNTDYVGAISAIEDGLRGGKVAGSTGSPLAGRLFVVIGAGGAGKALAYGAKEKGARVVIANRSFDRAQVLASSIGGEAITLAQLESFYPEQGMILANTTSIGMQPKIDETPIPKHCLKHYALAFDAVYTPVKTRLLQEAEESGAIAVSGLEMFIRQAKGQFELFTGLQAPESVMRHTVMSNL